ncbi:Periplasmic binding protein-like I [Moorella glycerini]|uniref:Leucine-, isoleucine-, valine-, threonine-, and alanine-binding protein n=2 Tax=Neomoorella stamsii TaxID=1266720 RepID=A0A9X7J2B4_9FIRM|nr:MULTISPECIES: substrate-binding domain-containing protein [Moorella]PRR71294.1 Leucine-, isoleucine-, valine-, threonine-, and alanine-binding protein precursor [Moorella stamsii]CEP66665.1 Periplasmic binding protein-like I [Moorella glycerini]
MRKKLIVIFTAIALLAFMTACGGGGEKEKGKASEAGKPIKIGVVTSLTGALETYGKMTINGLELGLDYLTQGKREVAGRPIKIVVEDTTTKPDVAKQKALKLLEEEKVDILVGSASSADALAILPLAQEYKRVMIVEPAVADSITGAQWNRYIFRTGRNSTQDALAAAAAIASAKPGASVAILAQDYSFGRDGATAFVKAAGQKGLKTSIQEFVAMNATDFTVHIQRIINASPDYLYVIWAGTANTPWKQIMDMKVADKGIKLITQTPEIAVMKAMKGLEGQEGFSIYYYGLPKNKLNDWLVEEHKKRFNGQPPDLFTCGGFAVAAAILQAVEKTGGDTGADKLIAAMEGMSFETPKGAMTFRKEDHQALQSFYHIKFEQKEGFDYPVPNLIREIKPDETVPPITNKRY